MAKKTKIELKPKLLKAYEVRDDGEGYCCIVFAANGATARRKGADELGTDWSGVESCRRVPELDQYAPGPVPPLLLIEKHGWWFECSYCGRRIHSDMADDLENDGLDPADFVPRADWHDGVFCSASCECAHHMEKRGEAEAEEALREVFEAKFPGATVVDVYCYGGPKLHAPKDVNSERGPHSVTFTFPGAKYNANWNFGDNTCWVPPLDHAAFQAWLSSREAECHTDDRS